MKRMMLVVAVVMVMPAVALGAVDCEAVSAGAEELQSAAGNYMATLMGLAMYAEGVDEAIIGRVAGHMGNPLGLMEGGRDGGAIAQSIGKVVKAKDAIMEAAGCAEEASSGPRAGEASLRQASREAAAAAESAADPMPCQRDGQLQPRVGMTLKRARECFSELRLVAERPTPNGLEQDFEPESGRGYITVRNGRIIEWGAY